MDPVTVGVIANIFFFLLLFIGVPVAFSLALTGFFGTCWLVSPEVAFGLLTRDIFTQFSSYPLAAILFFVLMGYYVSAAGISKKLYDTFYVLFGRLRGGLCVATIGACAGFAAICGSSVATAATMGKLALPEMKKRNYENALACGCVTAGGTLGPLIPPSNVFIIYGILTEQSIGKLFISGIIPGLIMTALLVLTVVLICYFKPASGPPGDETTWKAKLRALGGMLEVVALFTLVMVGLVAGWFVPSQAGAIGVVGALVIGLIRGMTWKRFIEETKEGIQTAASVLLLITGAVIYGHFMALTEIPLIMIDWVQKARLSPVLILGVIIVFYFMGGCLMDSLGFVVLTVPIIFPLITSAGIDPIWFGVIIVILTEVGTLTPPVGVNVYVVHQIAPEVPLETVFKGAIYFLPAMLICIGILILFPQVALFLPGLLMK